MAQRKILVPLDEDEMEEPKKILVPVAEEPRGVGELVSQGLSDVASGLGQVATGIFDPRSAPGTALIGGLQAAGGLGQSVDPLGFAQLENLLKTGVGAVSLKEPRGRIPPGVPLEARKAAIRAQPGESLYRNNFEMVMDNLSRLNVVDRSSPDFPTAGDPELDIAMEVLAGFIPLERAFAIVRSLRGLTKAQQLRRVAKEAGPRAAKEFRRAKQQPDVVGRKLAEEAGLEEEYAKALNSPTRPPDARKTELLRMQQLEAEVPPIPADQIPLELTPADFGRLRKRAEKLNFDKDDQQILAQQLFGGERTFPKTRSEMLTYDRALTQLASVDRKEPLLTGIESINPAKTSMPRWKKIARQEWRRGNFLDFRTANRVLRDQGKAGRFIAAAIDEMGNLAERRAGDAVNELDQVVRKLTPAQQSAVRRSLDYGEQFSDPAVAEATTILRKRLNDIVEEAKGLGIEERFKNGKKLPIKDVENYFPHQSINADKIRADHMKLVNHLLETNQFPSAKEASYALGRFVENHSRPRFGSFERAREISLPEEYYKTDLGEVLSTYYHKAYQRLEEVRTFGANDEGVNAFVQRIGAEGGNAEFAAFYFEELLGRTKRLSSRHEVSRLVRSANIPLLAIAQVINLSQSASTALRTRATRTGLGIFDTLYHRQTSKEFALRAGATLDSTLHDVARMAGGGTRFSDFFLKWTGFNLTERFNRVVAANSGRRYAMALTKELGHRSRRVRSNAEKELRRLGVSPETVRERGGWLVDDEMLRAGQQVVNDTQFRSRVQDLPLYWASPEGRVFFQYKNFIFNQTKLLKRELFNEIKRNPERALKNWAKAAIVYPFVGSIFSLRDEAKEAIAAELFNRDMNITEPDEDIVSAFRAAGMNETDAKLATRVFEDSAGVGSMGIFFDLWRSSKYGPKGAAGMIYGPSSEAFMGMAEAAGGEFGTLGRAAKRRIPFVGPFLGGKPKGGQPLFPMTAEAASRANLPVGGENIPNIGPSQIQAEPIQNIGPVPPPPVPTRRNPVIDYGGLSKEELESEVQKKDQQLQALNQLLEELSAIPLRKPKKR